MYHADQNAKTMSKRLQFALFIASVAASTGMPYQIAVASSSLNGRLVPVACVQF